MATIVEVLLHLPLLSSIVWFANALWPWAKGARYSPERAYVVGALCLAVWTLLDWFFIHTRDFGWDTDAAILVSKLRITTFIVASLAFLYFARWLNRPIGIVDGLVVIPVAASLAISWTVMTTGAEWVSWGPRLIREPVWYAVCAVQVGGYLLATAGYVGRALKDATFTSRATRGKLGAVVLGLVIAFLAWVVTNVYNTVTQDPGLPGFSSILIVPGILVLAFLSPVNRANLDAILRKLTVTPSRPSAAIWYHNSGYPLAQVVLRGSGTPDPQALMDAAQAMDHLFAEGFHSQPGALREMEHGEHRFVIERGPNVTLVVVVTGPPSEGLRSELRAAVRDFEAFHGGRLKSWESASMVAESALTALEEVLEPSGV